MRRSWRRDRLIPVIKSNLRVPLRPWYSARKASGVKRVIFVGESNGIHAARGVYRALDNNLPGSPFEVMSLVTGGTDLTGAERGFDEARRYSPDAIVVVFGHNLRFVPQPHYGLPKYLFLKTLRNSRLLWSLVEKNSAPPALDERLEAWRNFLERAKESARRENFLLVVYALQGNLRHRETPATADAEDPAYREALRLYEAGDKKRALRRLEELLSRRPASSWHYRLAEWHEAAGRTRDAYRHYALAQDRGSNRVNSGLNRITREMAADGGLVLADAAAIIEAAAPNGIPGDELFLDHCHLRLEKEWLLASACLEAFRRAKWPPGFHWDSAMKRLRDANEKTRPR